jgi:hypothetical protein
LNLEAAALLLTIAAASSEPRKRAARVAMRLILKAVPSAADIAPTPSAHQLAALRGQLAAELRAEMLEALRLTPEQRSILSDPAIPLAVAAGVSAHNAQLEAAALRHLEAAAASRPANYWN